MNRPFFGGYILPRYLFVFAQLTIGDVWRGNQKSVIQKIFFSKLKFSPFHFMGSFLSKQYTEEEMVQVKNLVEEIISTNKVVVFSKSYCRKYRVLKQ